MKGKKKLKEMNLSSLENKVPKCCSKNVKNWSSKFIHTFYMSNGSIKLKIADNDSLYFKPQEQFGRVIS